MINTLIKLGLRVFAFGHMIEVFIAIAETAYITASVAFVFGIFDYIASHYIRDCECE
tara:strand:+ start:65 stop:235 length:171 start_codon:yes stop_codon:yes gene_type:complete